MGSLSSASTFAQVQAQYDDNASYDVDNDLAKCRLFIEAARILIRRQPSTAIKSGNSVSRNVQLLKDELAEALAWLKARDPDSRMGPDVTYADVQDLRTLVEGDASSVRFPPL